MVDRGSQLTIKRPPITIVKKPIGKIMKMRASFLVVAFLTSSVASADANEWTKKRCSRLSEPVDIVVQTKAFGYHRDDIRGFLANDSSTEAPSDEALDRIIAFVYGEGDGLSSDEAQKRIIQRCISNSDDYL